jgi:hypothetical protein
MSGLTLVKSRHIRLGSVPSPGDAKSSSLKWLFFFGHAQDNDHPFLSLIYENSSFSMSISYKSHSKTYYISSNINIDVRNIYLSLNVRKISS